MSLKTSLFNKSIIKSDLKRFWWASALHSLLIFIFFTFIHLNEAMNGYTTSSVYNFATSPFYRNSITTIPVICVVAVVLAVMLFSYINSSNSVACLHGLPVKRKTFFASHLLSGYILLLIPVVLNVIILLLFRFNPDVAKSYVISHLFIWAGIYLIYSFVIFNGTCAVLMITGNNIAGIIFTYVFAFLPVSCEAFINLFLEQQLYGFASNGDFPVTNFLYMSFPDIYKTPSGVIKYILLGIIFIFISYLLYSRRKLENNGEVIAFSKLRKIFIYSVAICTGALGYLYFNAILNSKNILLLIPFGVLGIIIAEMVQKKSLKVKSAIRPIIIFSIFICIVQFAFQIDISGYERRIPTLDKIKSVTYDNNVNNARYEYTVDGKKAYYTEEDYSFTDYYDIEHVRELHKAMIEDRTDYDDGKDSYITITYELNNGRRIKRSYHANYTAHKAYLEPIIESSQIRKKYFPILSEIEKTYTEVSIYDERINDYRIEFYQDNPEKIAKVINALKEDTKITDYNEFAERFPEFTKIELMYKKPAKYEDGTDIPFDKLPEISEMYYVRKDYINTISLLKELGFVDKIPTADDVEKIGVNYYEVRESGERVYATKTDYQDYDKVIEDVDSIKDVYNFIEDYRCYNSNADMVIHFRNGHLIHISFSENDMNVPDVLKR